MDSKAEESVQVLEDRCPECGSTDLVYDYSAGEKFCRSCGLVIQDDAIDTGPEWRAFTLEEKASRSRVGMPTSYSFDDKGLSTSIGPIDRDALGRKLPFSTRIKMWRLKKWQYRSRYHSSIQRNLVQAMTELDRLTDKISLPAALKEKAAVIYRKALDKNLVQGRSIAAVVAASLYAACRMNGTPRSLRQVSKASLVNRKDVARCYRLLLRELDITMPVPDPLIFVPKIASSADVSGQARGIAIKVLQEAKQKHALTGKDPIGVAAAALYIGCMQSGDKKTQKHIADAAGVTEVTVRNRYKAMKRQLDLEPPD